ncbi:MAG: ribonuclease inhibitor [Verrucomicrobia bacterium]|nr:MAG: ribonuclease inhibitor [Verrucomicrobiota bacterium]
MSAPPDIVLFFGHFHPLLIHLPIGLILLVILLEALGHTRRFRNANAGVGVVLALAVPCAVLSAICGWLLSLAGGYDNHLLQWHKWLGFGTAGVCTITGALYALDLKKLYRASLWLMTPTLLVASHFGGSLTHGSDYLVRYAPAHIRSLLGYRSADSLSARSAQPATKDFSQLPVFSGLIQPILQQDCVSCHGPEKSKGGLRLDSLQALLKGGKSGLAIISGKSAESDLIRRLHLPPGDDDHMPPDGKPQPSSDDIALLQWWIDAGTPADKKVADLKPSTTITRILSARFAAPAPAVAATLPPAPLKDVLPGANKLAADLAIAVSPLAPHENWLQCNASVASTNFGDAQLTSLAALGPNLRWLDLGGTAVTDAGLGFLATMPNLTRLHLERTKVTDAGLDRLSSLANLEYLDLYGTAVSDDGLAKLQKLPKLTHLYLWQTKVSPAAAKAFAEARLDKDQLQKWQDEIEELKAKIRQQQVSVDLGVTSPPASTNAAAMMPTKTVAAGDAGASGPPINQKCPVSGKPVDTTKTVVQNGKVVAFCCDDCKAEFQKDPKPYLAKLGLAQDAATRTALKQTTK